ncbi:MAG: B12-binding domain-containing radical SAM protein [Candidatus Saccharicenans sp.]|nr:B12-binding domain-containing radical SAM protein [Candidatus Saccharicenans sp.]MDH7492643.1 radical SAM protein [Candidatus Saccharicenans sp.]
MIIKKISFLEAGSPGLHIFSKFPLPRLGAVLLSTMVRDRGYKTRVFVEDVAEPDWSFIESSDLVGISTITSTAVRAYAIADRIRALGIPVVMGGPHVTFLAEEALDHADFVIRGEGENSLLELLEHLEKGKPALAAIRGLSYRGKDGENYHNPQGELIQDLDSLPEPDLSLVHRWKPSNIYPISTSRGCPYGCRFCSVIQMFGRKYRFKSIEATLRELKRAALVSRATKFIVDDNFAADPGRTKEILRGILAEKIKMCWSTQVRVDVAKDTELVRLLADSGCHTLYIGFESINPATLQAYNKKQGLEDIIACIRTLKNYGIHIHGMFVLGADTDNLDTIRKTTEFARKHGIDTVQFLILTPLPGTPLFYDLMENQRLLHRDWSKYDAHHVVHKPALLTPLTLQVETFKAMARFYSWKYILRHLATLHFHYAAIGLFAKTTIRKFMESYAAELQALQSQLT